MQPQRYDATIVGGGPAGAAAAIMLARSGLRVLIVDARRKREASQTSAFQIGEGLPPSAKHLLRELGVYDKVLGDGHRASPGIVAFWGSSSAHFNDFIYQLHGPGLQLDRIRFDARLRSAATSAGATLIESTPLRIDPDSARQASKRPHLLKVYANDGRAHVIETTWVLDASGRSASIARALGASTIRYDKLLAVYQRLRSDEQSDRDGRTWVEAVEDGWWYSVLLPSGERLISFLFDADAKSDRLLLSTESLWNKFKHASHLYTLCMEHHYVPIGRIMGCSACSSALDRMIGPHWLAAGDAAIAFDPLSSKGISNALYTGIQAARTIVATDHGDNSVLENYATHLQSIHRTYRHHLAQFYAMEPRWPQATFWRSRHK